MQDLFLTYSPLRQLPQGAMPVLYGKIVFRLEFYYMQAERRQYSAAFFRRYAFLRVGDCRKPFLSVK